MTTPPAAETTPNPDSTPDPIGAPVPDPAEVDPSAPNPADPAETPVDGESGAETGAESELVRKLTAENAKRRRDGIARDATIAEREQTIADRDAQLADRDATIAGLQRTVIENAVVADANLPFLHRPADLFDVAGVDVADLTDADGNVDPARLQGALEQLATDRPYLFAERPTDPRNVLSTLYGNQTEPFGSSAPNTGEAWSTALKGTDQ